MKGNVKKILKVTYEESKIYFRRGTDHAYSVCFQYGLPLNTTKIPDSIWLLMNLDLMVPEGQQIVNEDIVLNVSFEDMSIDRSREICSGFWDKEYNELYGGDIQAIAKYLRIGQKFEMNPKGIWLEMINYLKSPNRLHALKCDGCLGNRYRSITQD
jgi:hypothetical protein